MKLWVCAVPLVVLLSALANAASIGQDERVRYDNYSVYKVKYANALQRSVLLQLDEESNDFNLWHEASDQVHVMVSPKAKLEFEARMSQMNASAEVLIENVQSLIQDGSDGALRDSSFGWTSYHTLEKIEAWLDEILASYPEIVTGFLVGQSYEGRDIRGIKISYKSGNPGVFIESNIHAREWITSATATWFINELLTSSDAAVRDLAENHDWYIVPVFNVDGFVYSHVKDRMWRKSRSPSAGSTCIGVDLNRNYDSHWMENGGASDNPCAETYAGLSAFSEPETKALSEYISGIKDKVNVLFAFHSYSQVLLSPYGHTDEEFPDNYDDLLQVAKAYADAVNSLQYGTTYRYGSSAEVLCCTNDWAYVKADIEISYTIEFRDTGHHGFLLPPTHIIPNAEETLAGITALLAESRELGYLELKYDL
ncbi:zinc carboxypeptidase-like isoform X2 [Scaptodrosophila lebanonensis]|uniref:Zinc carboxypeptidase-like isoform X2 n=1 Tax=Drosophila lebanonensis TaxID=7225 RepID=A0A6J2U3P1_DROLE|nr:zinc carboxypeptidase-like isoform X2 [Scaptodrosophila lebanonensis]